jgi:fumarate reductase subunit C
MSPRAYLLQRGTAVLMAPMVLTHLVMVVIAVQGGLSADDILARTRGSLGWGAFYTVFVLAAGLHAGIGLQTVAREWLGFGRRSAAIAGHVFTALLVVLGLRAVYAVVLA